MSKIEILWYNISQLVKIIIPFALVFIVIPVFMNRNKLETIPLKIIKGLTLAVFAAICSGYFLSLTKLFNLFYLTIIYFPLFFIMFIWVEGINVKEWRLAKNKKQKVTSNSQQPIANRLIFLIIFLTTFAFLFFLRGAQALYHLEIYYYDIFPHMVELKKFLEGNSILGLYFPMGQEAVIGFLKQYSFCDTMDIYRIIGPIQSTLILFTLYFIVSEITKNKYIALLVTTILGVDVSGIFPNVFYRQITGFHQEFALMFLLPVVYFAVQYMMKKQVKDLKYFIISVCNTLLIHVYIALIALFLFVAVFITGLLLKQWKLKTIAYIFLAGGLTALIGSFPVIIWSAIKKSYITTQWSIQTVARLFKNLIPSSTTYSDLMNFLFDMLNPIKDQNKWNNVWSANIIVYSILISLIYIAWRVFAKKTLLAQHIYLTVFAIGQTILTALYYGKAYNFPQAIHYERLAFALSLTTFSLLGILINELFNIMNEAPSKLKKPLKLTDIITISTIFVWAMIILPRGEVSLLKLQYEGALWTYVNIRDNFLCNSWTIVSPVEEYALSLGYGYHYELCNFPKQFNMDDAKNRSFSFASKIPSKHIFVFVEKNPLLIWSSLPQKGYYTETSEPYRLYSNRKKLEDYVASWMKEYTNSHYGLENNARVFYEDKDLIVYHIVN